MKLMLMFHDDWEIWGDGSGDCHELMFNPARKILDLCDRVGARYTFFAELGQQFAMKASTHSPHQKLAGEWEMILKDAVQRGHDVQLHFHPQWTGAKWEKDRWVLDFSRYSTARLAPGELKEWLQKGADYLKGLLKGMAPDYEVAAFRGGGFMVQPSGPIISALKEVGIRADATVIKGMTLWNESLGNVDFGPAPSSLKPWFPDSNDLAKPSPAYENLFCLPIYSFQTKLPLPLYSILNHPGSLAFSIRQYFHSKRQSYVPVYFRGQNQPAPGPRPAGPRPAGPAFLQKIFKERTLFLDFGMMHHSLIFSKVRSVLRQGENEGVEFLPMILYTHSKTFSSYRNFEMLLSRLSKEKDVFFETTRAIVNLYYEKWHNINYEKTGQRVKWESSSVD